MTQHASQSVRDLRIGVVGPRDLTARVLEVGSTLPQVAWRLSLIGMGYSDESEVVDLLKRQSSPLNAIFFSGPLPSDIAQRAGVVTAPFAVLRPHGSILFRTLLRAVLDDHVDVTHISIDTLSHADVNDAYADLGLDSRWLHVMPYETPESPEAFVDFHLRHHRAGDARLALTSVRSVAQRLSTLGVPTVRTLPTTAAIKVCLTEAILMGLDHQLAGSQVAICIVEIATTRTDYRPDPTYSQEDLHLAVHRALLQDARALGARVIALDLHTFVIATTLGPLMEKTRDFTIRPFTDRLRQELGVDTRVGIGLGHTVREAELNAYSALTSDGSGTAEQIPVQGPYGAMSLFKRQFGEADTSDSASLRLLDRLRSHLDDPTVASIVDAEFVGNALDVTPKTARRELQRLVNAGFAWPISPERVQKRGRPRQRYRLVGPSASPPPGKDVESEFPDSGQVG